jgi:hypothetical protein
MEVVRLLKIIINLLVAVLSGMFIGYLFDLSAWGWIATFGITFALLTVFQPVVDKVFLRL